MNRKAKIALGVAAFAPWIYLIIVLLFCSLFLVIPNFQYLPVYGILIYMLGALWIIMAIASLTAWFICIKHCEKSGRLKRNYLKWVLFFGFLWLFATPYYWYRFIWRDPEG